MTARSILFLGLLALATGVAAEGRAQPRRLIYNSDADNMFCYKTPPMKPADVDSYVDEVADAGVTTLFMCPNVGMVPNFPSQVTEMLGTGVSPEEAERIGSVGAQRSGSLERAALNLRGLVQAGHDPLRLVVERARRKQLEVFITFRLNECHCVDRPDAPPGSLLISKAWRAHPSWHIGKPGDKLEPRYREILGPRTSPIVGSWLPGGFNFAVPEVRQLRLAEIRECCERYPIDGLDLDFQRFPMYFRAGEEAANLDTMTQFVRDVRELTRRVGRQRGRALHLSVRVLARPEQNRGIGLDPIAWAREGLVDMVIASHYLRNDFPLPIADYRRLLPANVPLYGSIEVEPEAAAYRRIARQLREDGADGILLFNFFTTREKGKEPNFTLLRGLGDPAQAGIR